jgi:hypothetical protein
VSRFVFGFLAGAFVSKEESVMNARVSLVTGIVTLGLFVHHAVAITGGKVDENNTYRNVGCVVAVLPDGSPPFVGFSGTLIHPRVLLTAGHCTDIFTQSPELIAFSSVSFSTNALDPSTWREIEAAITHPGYQPRGLNNPATNDVGVVILKEPIYDLPLAKLPYKGLLDDLKAAGLLRERRQGGVRFTVAGYGSTLDWPPPESIPGDGWRRFAESRYRSLTQSWLFLQQNLATGDGGTGYGDSGGPTFWVDTDGSLVLVSLTSRGDPKLVATGITWRVDIRETLDFIASVIAGLP